MVDDDIQLLAVNKLWNLLAQTVHFINFTNMEV